MKRLQQKAKELEKEVAVTKNENTILQRRNQVLDKESDKLMDRINKVINTFPDEVSDQFIERWNNEKSREKQRSFDLEI